MAAAVSVEAVASPANEFDDNDSSEQDLRSSVSTALAGDEELDEEEVDVIRDLEDNSDIERSSGESARTMKQKGSISINNFSLKYINNYLKIRY